MIYAPGGSPEFNARLHQTLQQLAADVVSVLGDNLRALVLGGGYGRGEGAVILRGQREYPYNDLDLFLVVRSKRNMARSALAAVAATYSNELRIEVDIGRPLVLHDVRNLPAALMWHDLLAGHVVLAGSRHVLSANAPAHVNEPPPPIEATRLLLNRGAGLLWAKRIQRGLVSAPDDDFIRRNYHKCVQAIGDAVLLSHRIYTSLCDGRAERLERLSRETPAVGALEIVPRYIEALQFKTAPDRILAGLPEHSTCDLAKRWGDAFLYVEQLRTHRLFAGLQDYADWAGLREPDRCGLTQIVPNLLRNRSVGRCSWRHPREQLYRELPVLLCMAGDSPATWPGRSKAFLRAWSRFN